METLPWFTQLVTSPQYALLKKKPLAYFCIEYALSSSLPTYAGGLGVLAGDYVRELADQHIPAVAVGLYYQSKYGVDGTISVAAEVTPEQQELTPVTDSEGKPLMVSVSMLDHTVYAKAWRSQKDTVPVYLLDPNIPENNQADRAICYKLYDANKEIRLKQELLLGIGGFRLLEALHIEPSIYHMNEGHSSLLLLELIRHEMQKRHIGFKDAVALASHHVVFTNHTLLASGNEIYSNELFGAMMAPYASELEVPVADIMSLGQIADSTSFSLSLFALRLAGKINAVSKLHALEAQKAWVDFQIQSVTNGIHVPNWDEVKNLPVAEAHSHNKRKLLDYIHEQTGAKWGENELLIGWARRLVRYKRPLALFAEIEKLKAYVNDTKQPIRIVLSGVAHQGDEEGREFIKKIQALIRDHIPQHAVFLSHYSTDLARLMVSGCDVWLNTPVVGSEACGTSGMKACLNGTLPLTTKDGWIDEVDIAHIGWLLNSDAIHDNLLEVLKHDVAKAYYDEDHSLWEDAMQDARELILKDFSASRMLKEYFEKLYLPVIAASQEHYLS